MLKKYGPFAVALCLVAFFVWLVFQARSPEKPAARESTEADAATVGAANATGEDGSGVSLALKAIELSQGEHGSQLWRLKTDWASMRKEDGRILVEQPKLTYYMPPDNKELHVRSLKGDVRQKEKILRFVHEVRATYEDSVVTGDLLVYNGTAKTMTFPQGGEFIGRGVTGSAPQVVWRMDNKIIEASGGVQVEFSPPPRTPEKEAGTPASGNN